MRGLREEEAATKGNTLEVDKLRALVDHLEGANEEVSRTVHLGLISELRFKVEALERGYDVYDPVSPASKADVIIRKSPNRPVLIQVKRAGIAPSGGWRFTTCSRSPTRGAVQYRRRDFDFYAVHVDDGARHFFGFWPFAMLFGSTSKVWHPPQENPPPDNWDILEEGRGAEE